MFVHFSMDFILGMLDSFRLLAVFLGAFFFGDSVLFTVAYITGQKVWAAIPIVAVAFLGTAAADTLWYIAGRIGAKYVARVPYFLREREKAARLLERLSGTHPAYALVFIKFLYGSRIAMILYVAARGISFPVFTLYNSLGILAWLAVFFPLGYLAGRGVSQALPALEVVQAAVIVFIVSFILLRLLSLWLTRNIEKT